MFPRLLTPRVAPTYDPQGARIKSGIPGFDKITGGGFWRGSTSLIAGPNGSGKTVSILHFIREGALHDEPGLFVGFQENPSQVARLMLSLGWNARDLLDNAKFELMYRSPVEMPLDSVAAEIFKRVREGKVRRVAIDALGDLERCSIDTQRFADFMYALIQWFAVENVTCVMTYELPELYESHRLLNQLVANMTDNLVILGLSDEEKVRPTIRVIKTRGSAHDNRRHFLTINGKGAAVTNK